MEASEKHYTSFHFSHQHSLELTISPSKKNDTCKGCNLKILSGKDFYHCKTCSFSLHRVCFDMPRRSRHLSHPNHNLTLFDSGSSATRKTLECKACGNCIRGFYYSCNDCDVYYHIPCLALPLSVALPTHPHALKMEFSPPYEFNCDLCDEPSNRGWLYRCRYCEFDAHISCAISNKKPQINYGCETREMMQLIVQGVDQGMWQATGRVVVQPAVAGWDERLRSPVQNPQRGQAQISPISQDTTIPSYQFSDFCFSIDLLNSYPNNGNREALSTDTSCHDIVIVPEPDIEGKIRFGKVAMSSKKLDHDQGMQVNNPLYGGPKSWLVATPEEDNYGVGGRSKIMGQGGNMSRSNLIEKGSISTDVIPVIFHDNIFLSFLFLV